MMGPFRSRLCKTRSRFGTLTLQCLINLKRLSFCISRSSDLLPSPAYTARGSRWDGGGGGSRWDGGGGQWSSPALCSAAPSAPTLDSALMKAREREVEEARRGETRSWHGSGVPERLFWICGPGRWVKVKSLLSQQMSSCLLPKRSSSLVSQRIPYWDTSPRKSSWFGILPLVLCILQSVTLASFVGGSLPSV